VCVSLNLQKGAIQSKIQKTQIRAEVRKVGIVSISDFIVIPPHYLILGDQLLSEIAALAGDLLIVHFCD
jgi:hypothetical protein